MNMPSKVELVDVGLRDGLQNEKTILSVEEKLKIVHMLEKSGFKSIQLGSFVHPKAVPQMANTDEIFQQVKRIEGIRYFASPIPNMRGLERAIACGCNSVRIAVSASKEHNLRNYKCTPEETINGFKDVVIKAHENNIYVDGGVMMAFGSPWDAEIAFEDIKNILDIYSSMGINEFNICDTAGMANPTQVYEMCLKLKECYPNAKWSFHFHNTRGLALANIVAAMQAGMTVFETSFSGLGGCPFVPNATGNISTEDTLNMLNGMGVETGLDINNVIETGKLVSSIVNHEDSFVLKAGTNEMLMKSMADK